MTININDSITANPSLLNEESRQNEIKTKIPSPEEKAIETATITEKSSQIQSIQQRIEETPIVDQQKVMLMKSKIANNELDIIGIPEKAQESAKRISDKILEMEQEIYTEKSSEL